MLNGARMRLAEIPFSVYPSASGPRDRRAEHVPAPNNQRNPPQRKDALLPKPYFNFRFGFSFRSTSYVLSPVSFDEKASRLKL
jgi:hypothetical protein